MSVRNFKLTKHLGFSPEQPIRQRSMKHLPTRLLQGHIRHSSDPGESLPRIKQWNRAIQKQKELVSLVDRRLNQSSAL